MLLGIGFIHANGRTLLAALHAPPRLRPRPVAVLLCSPFGEEAARAHRAFRVLAQRLEQAGYAAMRFDYAGTGDSQGDSGAFSVDDWVDDIAAAAADLRERSGSPRVALVGLRLGGALAALCARRAEARLAHLLLWDPVVDGAAYVRELGQAHRAYLQAETGRAFPDAGDAPEESLGVPLDARLRAGLAGIDLTAERPRVPATTVLCTRRTPALQRLHDAWSGASPPPRWIDVDAGSAWNSDEALNSAIVPIAEVMAIVARIEACHP